MSLIRNNKPICVGLSITRFQVELVTYSPKTGAIEKVIAADIPLGVFDGDADQITDPMQLKAIIGNVIRSAKASGQVHLSLPGTLFRMAEMPRMEPDALYLALSTEAERYRTFDGTEAIVDFKPLDSDKGGAQQPVVFGAVRSDTLAVYLKICKDLRIKPYSISLEPINVLRALGASGILDGLIHEIGSDAYWGSVFVEHSRVRFMIWQANRLIELRETAMEIPAISNDGSADFFIVEDLLEEIRRTTKNTIPSVWVTHDLPDVLRKSLSERLGCPFFPTMLGESLAKHDPTPVSLAAVGTAMTSFVEYPCQFDINRGLTRINGSSASSNTSTKDLIGPDDSGPGPLIMGGGILAAVAVFVSLILFFMNMMTSQQVPDLTSKRDSVQMQVSALQSEVTELKRKSALDSSLLEAVHNAQIRNQIYIALTSDLKRKTPQQVWLETLTAGEILSVSGKAMNQSAVIHFAQSFDDAPYTKAILIDSIAENKVSETTVFDFKFSGGIKLAPQLLPSDPTTPNTESSSTPQSVPQ
jgi:hypothetical protein